MTCELLVIKIGPFEQVKPLLEASFASELALLFGNREQKMGGRVQGERKTVRGQSLLSTNQTRAKEEMRHAVLIGSDATPDKVRMAGGRAWSFPALLPGSWHGKPLRGVAAILPVREGWRMAFNLLRASMRGEA